MGSCLCAAWGLAQGWGGHAKLPSAPVLFPSIARDAANPSLEPPLAGVHGGSYMPGSLSPGVRAARCITPLFLPTPLAPLAKSAAPRPPGAAGLPARHNTNQMMYSKQCQYAHPQEREAGRGNGGK